MATFLIAFFTVILLLVCVIMTVIILMQRSSANAGMGTALGGGAAESVFGGETANVLLKNTVIVAVLFFVLSFGLYLGTLAKYKHRVEATGGMPTLGMPAKVQTMPTAGNVTSAGLPGATGAANTAVPVNFVPPTTGNATSSTTTSTSAATSAATATTSTATTGPANNTTAPAK